MASVPSTGQITVSDIISAANDQYATTDFSTNVYLSSLRARLKLGQSDVPSSNSNVGFSTTRNSQFITYKITAYPETTSTYATNNNGKIEVEIDEYKLAQNGTSVTVTLSTGTTQTRDISNHISSTFSFTSLNGGPTTYTVTTRDNSAAHQVSDNIIVPYGGTTNNIVYRNRA